MMFLTLLALVSSSNPVEMVDDKYFKKVIKQNEYVIALLIDEKTEDFWQQTEKFSHIVESGSPAKYIVITNENAAKTYKRYSIGETGIAFFINSTAMFATKMPMMSEGINHVVRTAIMNVSTTVDTLEDFQNYFIQFDYTIVSPEEMENEAREFYIRHTFSRGPLGFCVFNKTFYESLGLNSSKLTLYRSSEDVFQQFESTDQSLNEAYENYVSPEIDDEMILSKKLLVIPCGPLCDEINLLDVAKRVQTKHIYGMLNEFAEAIVEPVLEASGLNQSETRFIACVNATGFWMYEPLTDNLTTEGIVQYLNDIEAGKIGKIYASEPIPENNNKNGLIKLVGKTYEEFLKNDENNDFVFYVNNYTADSMELIENFSSYIKENDIKGIRTAIISINNNSVPSGFPEQIRSPHTEFFPAKKHNESKPYVGSNGIYSLLLFAQDNSNISVKLNKDLLDEDLEKKIIDSNTFAAAMTGSTKFQELNNEYIVKIGTEMGLSGNVSEIYEALFPQYSNQEEEEEEAADHEEENATVEEGEADAATAEDENATVEENATQEYPYDEYSDNSDSDYDDYSSSSESSSSSSESSSSEYEDESIESQEL